jgi:hypothetical protein
MRVFNTAKKKKSEIAQVFTWQTIKQTNEPKTRETSGDGKKNYQGGVNETDRFKEGCNNTTGCTLG